VALVDPGGVGRENFVSYLNVQQANDKEVRDVLRSTKASVKREMRNIPGNSVSEQIRSAQYAQVRDAIAAHEREGWVDIGRTIQGNVGRATSVASEGTTSILDILGDNLPEELRGGMQAAAETSGERVAGRIASQIDLSPRVYRNADLTAGRVDAVINNGIASNQSAKEIAQAVSGFISPDAPGGMSYSAMRLGRTELNNAYHATTSKLYDDQPWVEASKWRLSGSHPKHDICNELAESDNFGLGNGVYRTNEIPAKPHPQCLCYTVPITPSRKDFVNNLLSGRYNDWLEENNMEPL
jgi:hypothetical protein